MVITQFISDDLTRKLNHNKSIRIVIFLKKIWLGKARMLSFFLNWSIQSALFCVFSFYLFFPVLTEWYLFKLTPKVVVDYDIGILARPKISIHSFLYNNVF